MKHFIQGWHRGVLLAGFAMGLMGTQALAYDDTSAIVPGGFAKVVQSAQGVVLRVEIDAAGQENRDSATMRVNQVQARVTNATEAQKAFIQGVNADVQPQVTAEDLESDSNTHGWWRYRWNGWAQPYYYYNYTPVYYNYGYSYSFYRPTYYNVWSYPISYRYYYWY